MTSIEKAANLIIKFSVQLPYYTKKDNMRKSTICALICVEETLQATLMYTGNLNPTWKYWNDVKEELLKLQ